MVTRKLTALALCCLALFSSCSKDDENTQELKEELAAEKSKTVVDIKKEGEQLIIVYSNGTTASVPYTDAIKGNIGGSESVGVESISYNSETAILTIKLTNGEVAAFRITGTGADWDAVLIGDASGSLFITEALLGAVPVIKAEYNDSYQLTYLESNQAMDAQVRKVFGITKNYRNGALDNYSIHKYATTAGVSYTTDWSYNGYTPLKAFPEHKGAFFKVANSSGTYTVYTYAYSSGAQYYYYELANSLVVSSNDPRYDKYQVVEKKGDKQFYYYSESRTFGSEKVFALTEIITIQGQVAVGDVESSLTVDVENDAAGRVTRAYEATEAGGQATKYISYEYNQAGLVKTTRAFEKNAQGNWVTGGEFETYNYDADNRLVSTTRTSADGRTQDVQKAVYDQYGNPTEIWAWQPAVYDWGINPETGERGYQLVREAGLQKVATLEYNYKFKNFLGNTISALVPELEGYRVVNALKRVTVPNSYSFANIEYVDFDEYGYPRRMKADASYLDDLLTYGEAYAANMEVVLHYKVKSK